MQLVLPLAWQKDMTLQLTLFVLSAKLLVFVCLEQDSVVLCMQVIAEARNLGLRFYCEQQRVDPSAAVAGGGSADDDEEDENEEEEVEDDESAGS